jgi:hypothetical protein
MGIAGTWDCFLWDILARRGIWGTTIVGRRFFTILRARRCIWYILLMLRTSFGITTPHIVHTQWRLLVNIPRMVVQFDIEHFEMNTHWCIQQEVEQRNSIVLRSNEQIEVPMGSSTW